MLLFSCVVWRHLEWDRFRAECPGGDERLQRLIWERLDDALGWLESLGAKPLRRDTENPVTIRPGHDPRAGRRARSSSRRRFRRTLSLPCCWQPEASQGGSPASVAFSSARTRGARETG